MHEFCCLSLTACFCTYHFIWIKYYHLHKKWHTMVIIIETYFYLLLVSRFEAIMWWHENKGSCSDWNGWSRKKSSGSFILFALRLRTKKGKNVDICAHEQQLRGFEFVKAVTLVVEPFTVENGILTPTFKASALHLFSSYRTYF